ncbi:MAG: carbon starvation CstA 5TM domain-containing protein [Dysosmobacter sp.]
MKSERQGRMTFYNMMVLEGFIAMVWAAAAMGVYNLGLQEVNASLSYRHCRRGLQEHSGACRRHHRSDRHHRAAHHLRRYRSARPASADLESFHIDQSSKSKRVGLSAVIFALVAVILVFAKMNSEGFNILWRYFAWSNQTLSLFAFLAISVWMFENGKAKWVWMPLIPGAWYTFITITYIMNAHIGFKHARCGLRHRHRCCCGVCRHHLLVR